MIAATSRKSSSSKPRIVAAGVPSRTPDATIGGRSSNGTVFRFAVSLHSSSRSCAASPVHSVARRSSCTRCVSVPPVSTSWPPSHAARRRARRRSRGSAAGTRGTPRSSRSRSTRPSRRSRASAGRPACRGSSRGRASTRAPRGRARSPARGPASVLWLVEVTKSQCGTGFGWMPGGDEPGEVRHVAHQQRADLVGDLAEAVGLDRARVRRAAADDQLRPHLLRAREHLVVVDLHRLARDAVVVELVELPGEVDLQPVRQVAAVVEREPEHAVARARAPRSRRPCSPARPRAAARSRARRRTAPSRASARAPRSRRRPRSRRSSACRDSPRRTCSSAPSRPPRTPTAR